jgi:hypothetical protein
VSYHYRQVPAYQALGISWGDLNPARWIGAGVSKIAPTISRTSTKVSSSVKSTVCPIVQTPGGMQGAMAAGGGPVGMVGLFAAGSACGPAQPPVMPLFPPQMPIMPIVLAVGALVVIAAVTKPRKAAPTNA